MRTSLNQIKAIDEYLSGGMMPEDAFLFEANLLLNSNLSEDTAHQKQVYTIVKDYSRKQLKAEILAVRQTLSNAPQHQNFIQRINNLFKK